MTGGLGGGSHAEVAQPAAPQQVQQEYYQPPAGSQQPAAGGACQFEIKQFLECAQNQYDLSICQGFSDAMKECKIRYGMFNVIIVLLSGS
jgi:coiled-coil-helix-coiled-coil-helix domain-containing protein 2